MDTQTTALPPIASREEWIKARKELWILEREATHARDALAAKRRQLPMKPVNKNYMFEGPDGPVSLGELFEGRRQLIIYHFMFDPAWTEGCPSCSFVIDNLPHLSHLKARDTSFAMVSRAPLQTFGPFKERMGWKMPWVSSFGTDFNYDFHTTLDESIAPIEYNFKNKEEHLTQGHNPPTKGETPGLSVFIRDDAGNIYHTYSTYSRGLEVLLTTYQLLDLTPFGRQETWQETPEGFPQDAPDMGSWLRYHDKYDNSETKSSCCHS